MTLQRAVVRTQTNDDSLDLAELIRLAGWLDDRLIERPSQVGFQSGSTLFASERYEDRKAKMLKIKLNVGEPNVERRPGAYTIALPSDLN